MSSYLAPYTARPADGTCWICPGPVPADRRDKVPALCSDTCRDAWRDLNHLPDPATHEATDSGWYPLLDAAGGGPR